LGPDHRAGVPLQRRVLHPGAGAEHFFGVSDDVVPAYSIPFAFGNLLGPLLLGRLFDSVGAGP
jgi:hypothetical protein